MDAVETIAALVTESVLVEPTVSAADAMSVLVAITVEDTAATTTAVLSVVTVVTNPAVDNSTIFVVVSAAVVSISVVVSDVDGALVFNSAVDRVSFVTVSADVLVE